MLEILLSIRSNFYIYYKLSTDKLKNKRKKFFNTMRGFQRAGTGKNKKVIENSPC